MKLSLEGQTALISGSTNGIGLVTAKTLVDEGVRVVVVGRTESSVSRALGTLEAQGTDRVIPIVADLSTAEGANKVIAEVPEVDILVNNLGFYEPVNFFDITDAQWKAMFETNVFSAVRLSRHYLKSMLDKKTGRVIFVSSEVGMVPDPHMVHYSASKSVLLSIARGLAELTKGTNVTVNAVVPGPTKTEGLKTYIENFYPDLSFSDAEKAFIQDIRPSSLIQRLAKPEEVGALIAFLSSHLGGAINGDSVRVEGGTVRSIV